MAINFIMVPTNEVTPYIYELEVEQDGIVSQSVNTALEIVKAGVHGFGGAFIALGRTIQSTVE